MENAYELRTSRYTGFQPEYGVPVRVTVGAPRWFPYPYEYVPALAPYGILKNANLPTLAMRRDAFMRRLDSKRDEMLAALDELAAKYPGVPLVLLCYENVHKGEVCHRRWIADWFRERMSVIVPEIGAPCAEPHAHEPLPPTVIQSTLF